MKQYLQLGLILVLLTGLNVGAFAQRKYPDMTVSISSGGSDYSIRFIYDHANSANCDCVMEGKEKYYLDMYKNGDSTQYRVLRFTGEGHLTSDTIDYIVGPNVSGNWGLRYESNCDACTSNEVFWVWSGFPVATSSTHPSPYSVLSYAATAPIKSPNNLTASDQTYYDKIVLTWTKGSDIPDTVWSLPGVVGSVLQYKIYRGTTTSNGTWVATLPADARSWTDNTVEPNNQFYYWVTTYTNGWNGHESSRTTANAKLGKTKTLAINASDSLYTNSVKVTWPDLSSFADEIRIERSVPGGTKEELDILSKNSTAYSDVDAIPGYNYTYYVTPIKSGRIFTPLSNTGFKKANGIISGYVKSLLNAGVNDVKVCATLQSTIPAGAVPMPAGGYCATTDMDGYFEIRNIYYFDGAQFSIVPSKGSPPHLFAPATITRRLDLNSKTSSGVNFTDQSVFTVGGMVSFPTSSTNVVCGVPDVEIKLNGESRGIFTKPDGSWSFALQDEGSYKFKPVFLHHHFENAQGQTESTFLINGNKTDINFTDKQVDEIKVKVQGGCGDAVAPNTIATVRVTSAGNCFDTTYVTDAGGLVTLSNLPARVYDVQVDKLTPNNDNIFKQIGNKPIRVDLTVRDTSEVITTREVVTIVPADTLFVPNGDTIITPAHTTTSTVNDTTRGEVIPVAEFIYHSPLKVTVDFANSGAKITHCNRNGTTDKIILMEQNTSYSLVFEVVEELGNCPVKEGKLRIFDFVSDRGDDPVEISIVNGFATYMVTAGLPELATSNHEKLIYVVPEVGFLAADPVVYWIMVTGVQTHAPSFITRSPELPLLILHDPPGDNSSAFVEKGTEFRSFQTTEMKVGGEAGAFANLMVGAKVLTPFSSTGAAMFLNFSAVAGTDEYWRDGLETTITFNERFSTSDMENLNGNAGDVYIGASFNQEFAVGDELTFDESTCSAKIDVIPTIDITGFATTFVYTEKHLINTLLPTLGTLRAEIIDGRDESELTEEEKVQANQLLYDSLHWESVIAQNKANRDTNATFVKNVSFSAGAPYNSEYTTENKNSESFEYNAFINLEFAIGAKITNEAGAWFDSQIGATAKFRWATKGESGTDETTRRNVGYTLDDGDLGDYFSVDIKEDTAYGVPAFDLKLGTTSCPHEEGSQPRDAARLWIDPPQRHNVPIGEQAVFVANLINESESREKREYSLQVISTTNPDGAIVKVAGELINFKPAMFSLEYMQQASISLTVERGPLATNYEKIGIIMFPPCEMELWTDGGDVSSSDTAWIYVDFQSECSNVSLYSPGDGWLVNRNNNDLLHISFTGYDANNEKLESITLQYKKEGQGWLDDRTVLKSELSGFFFDYYFNVSGLSDGAYRLRAKAYCGTDGGFSYSSEQAGIIDRTSLAPFGMPSPADGFLRLGQEISVTFDKNIDCDFGSYNPALPAAYIKLFKEDSTEIPITVQCSETQNKLILVPVVDLFTQPDLEGVKLFATVEGIRDVSGNVQKYPTQWSFQVNVSPVAWNPNEVFMSAEETENVAISANLDNGSVISKSFVISDWPDWVVPSVLSASILPGNSFTIQFSKVESLKPGLYTGQVTALVDNVPELLTITLELYAKEINWEVNQHGFEYNMNVTAQFSADQGNTNLSTSKRDKIAAYINGDLRGVGNISFIPELNKYAAFINVFSNLAGKNGSLIESEEYVLDNSVQDITITDNGVSSGASRFKKTNWIEFDIYATKDGTRQAEFRVASIKPGAVQLLVDGTLVQTINIPNTVSLTTYTTVPATLSISKGTHKFRILSTVAEFDLNWINFPEYHVRNQHNDQVIKFRMWDGLNGIEYGAIEELTFFNDGMVGNAQNPFLLHPAGGIQDVVLEKGWNWISVNKVTPDMRLGKVFESITPPTSLNDLTLKSQTAFSQFMQSTGWLGGLTSIDPRLGYMIYLSSHPDTLSMVGNTPESNGLLTLNPKWNWIGYPKPAIKPVSEYLTGFTAATGDLLKSQLAFAEFNISTGTWIGDLSFFEPGKGYKLFVSNGGTLNMLKSASPGNLDRIHEYNMTMTAAIQLGGVPASDELYLQTYINEQLRGVVPLTYVDALGKNMAFAMIYGDRADIGEQVKLLLWDEKLQKSMSLSGEEIRFGIDEIKGTLRNPVLLSVQDPWTSTTDMDHTGRFTIWPNPFSNQTFIRYSITGETHVSLIITNPLGAEVIRIVDMKQATGDYQYIFKANNLPTGMYYCTLKTDTYVETRKIILFRGN